MPLRFAYVGNGNFADDVGVAMREKIATVLAAYPDVRLAAEIVPPPGPPTAGRS